ncbi:MAG: hypothetical protein NWF07_16355 [Candidatus Bathyarchaeota archaeon]|nr:hypothetical protein [Candidatus Bathyarchaeota archaeon]
MKKIIPLVILAIIMFMVPTVEAETSLTIDLTPELEFNQVWAYETYQVNVSFTEFNLSDIDFTGYSGTPVEILFEGKISWKGKGGYDFGTATTGYNYNLDDLEVNFRTSLEEHNEVFNLTLENDALDYGMKPFESVQIVFKFDAYIVMSDDPIGLKIDTKTKTVEMVDDTKVRYLEGKYSEMQDEINTVIDASGLESFNRERYQNILTAMNTSLTNGDYIEALDIWDDYNEGDREDMINGIVKSSNTEYEELESLRELQDQLSSLEQDLELLQLEYDQLENTYVALASTYNKVNQELDTVKGNLSTAITAVFLTAIGFYFLGRRSVKKEVEVENA